MQKKKSPKTRRKSIQRGKGLRCSEIPVIKHMVNIPGENCYRINERKTIDDYISKYNPEKARYIEEFLRMVKRIWELRDDIKDEIGFSDVVRKADHVTSSVTLRWKLFDLIGETYSMDELNRLKRRYLDKLPDVNAEVMRIYKLRYKKLDSEHQGIIQYIGKK